MIRRVGKARAAVITLGLAISVIFLLPIGQAGVNTTPAPAYAAPPGNGDLAVQVLRADGDSLRGTAKIRLAAAQGVTAETLADPKHHQQARFRKIPLGFVRLQVVADGFATVELKLLLEQPGREMRLTIYLRTAIQGQSGGEGYLPPLSAIASTHFARAVDLLRKGEIEKSREQFRKLRAAELGDSNVQYLAGILDYRSGNIGMALFHFSQAAYLNPEGQDSARALAGLLYRIGVYGEAYEDLSRLVRNHPQDWELAWEAASAAFLSAQYLDARQSAQAAVSRGGAAALRAGYLLAYANAMLENWPEAREAAIRVAVQSGDPALTAAADALRATLDLTHAAGASLHYTLASERAEAGLFPAIGFEPRIPVRLWAPPDVDAAMPKLVPSAPCNAAEILNLAGRRVVARLEQLGEVAAKDYVELDAMGVTGRVTPLGRFTADYLPDVLLQSNGSYDVEEFLAGLIPELSPGSGVEQGRASLVKIFEPAMQPDYTFECEGLTIWKDHLVWSLHFAHRKDRPARLGAYNYSGRFFPAYIHGRGYVDQASGELLHMETDLENPIPELQLADQHLVVDYFPVKFQSANQPYYLPSQAELYLNVREHLYRRRDDFKEYVRFGVATHQEVKQPSGQE